MLKIGCIYWAALMYSATHSALDAQAFRTEGGGMRKITKLSKWVAFSISFHWHQDVKQCSIQFIFKPFVKHKILSSNRYFKKIIMDKGKAPTRRSSTAGKSEYFCSEHGKYFPQTRPSFAPHYATFYRLRPWVSQQQQELLLLGQNHFITGQTHYYKQCIFELLVPICVTKSTSPAMHGAVVCRKNCC